MPPFDEFLRFYAGRLLSYVPTLLALTAGVAIVSLSPLGRGLLRFLRERRRDALLNEQILDELVHLRTTLGEVTERLDATERLLSMRGEAQIPASPRPDRPAHVSTPH